MDILHSVPATTELGVILLLQMRYLVRITALLSLFLALDLSYGESLVEQVSVWKLILGEDSTSSYYYFAVLKGDEIRRIRYIWNGGCCSEPTVEEIGYRSSIPTVYVRFTTDRKQLPLVTADIDANLPEIEIFNFRDSEEKTNSRLIKALDISRDVLKTFMEHQSQATKLR